MKPLLQVSGLHAWYGESHILHGVDMTVGEGEMVTLLGRNGVGKTTTLKSIMGMVGRRDGSVVFDGVETITLPSNRIARLGIAFCPEERGIFASLNVVENLLLLTRLESDREFDPEPVSLRRLLSECIESFSQTGRARTVEVVEEGPLAVVAGQPALLAMVVDNLLSNWAYMLMTALAWNLKAWFALTLPEQPGRHQERRREEKQRVLRMEFKTFVNALVKLPCQVVEQGRRRRLRVLAWNEHLPVFFRLCAVLRC